MTFCFGFHTPFGHLFWAEVSASIQRIGRVLQPRTVREHSTYRSLLLVASSGQVQTTLCSVATESKVDGLRVPAG